MQIPEIMILYDFFRGKLMSSNIITVTRFTGFRDGVIWWSLKDLKGTGMKDFNLIQYIPANSGLAMEDVHWQLIFLLV